MSGGTCCMIPYGRRRSVA